MMSKILTEKNENKTGLFLSTDIRAAIIGPHKSLIIFPLCQTQVYEKALKPDLYFIIFLIRYLQFKAM